MGWQGMTGVLQHPVIHTPQSGCPIQETSQQHTACLLHIGIMQAIHSCHKLTDVFTLTFQTVASHTVRQKGGEKQTAPNWTGSAQLTHPCWLPSLKLLCQRKLNYINCVDCDLVKTAQYASITHTTVIILSQYLGELIQLVCESHENVEAASCGQLYQQIMCHKATVRHPHCSQD